MDRIHLIHLISLTTCATIEDMITPSRQLVFRTLLAEGIREGLFWPLWWYSRGLSETTSWLLESVKGSIKFFGVDVWIKNLFVPMYGDASIAGSLISFGVRAVMILIRSLGVMVWVVAAILLFFLYLLAFPLALFGFFGSLIGVLV
ncbi:hypothetical protein HZA87_02265 [Candidatus Uhrbacteria bacterium]|nr:hypothetical protein [Candidatus Uhrbacteria bacterium]